jgi:hypothetical protein
MNPRVCQTSRTHTVATGLMFLLSGAALRAAALILANLGRLQLRARDLVPLALVAFGARLLYRARTAPKGAR